MKSKLKQLLFIAILSATMAACSTNPVNNGSGGANNTAGNTTGNTNTGGSSTDNTNTNDGGYTSGNTNNGNTNTSGNTDTGNNTDDGYYASTPNQRGFVVQLTASISQQKANTVKNTFVAEGYPIIQNNIKTNGRILYRVQVGPYATQGEARAVLNKMRKRYKRNPYVNRAIINENK
jgi:septal ring-binding cell division protein DamX